MLNKKIMVLTVLLACLLAISAVSAQNPAAGTDNETIMVESTDETVLGSSAMDDLENDNRPLSVDTDSGKLEKNEGEVLGDEINVTGDSFTNISKAIRDAKSGDIIYLQEGYYKGDGNQITIDKDLTIIGGFKEGDGKYAILDAQQLSRIFRIDENAHVTLQGIKFINGLEFNGGAIHVGGGCTLIDCIFANNKATRFGGAVYWEKTTVGISNCTFENNHADNDGGANYFSKEVTNINLTGNFINNTAKLNGGANYFFYKVTNVTLTGNFINNSAEDGNGGANYFFGEVNNVSLVANFTGNSATYGGANLFYNLVNVNLTDNFTNNTAMNGGANNFNRIITNVTLSGNFINNSAELHGGANYFHEPLTNVILTCNFTNNTAKRNGGANNFNGEVTNVTLTGNFMSNSAETGNGGANFFYKTVADVTFTGNYINNTGLSVIYIKNSVSGNVIHDSIFINNAPMNIGGKIDIIDNWFGNNATNYNIKPDEGIDLDNWLFLNGTANPNPVSVADTTNIIFKLSRYDKNGVSSYDNSRLLPIKIDITSTLGSVNPKQVNLNESITYAPGSIGNCSVTATFENVKCTIKIETLEKDPELDAYFKDNITYGEDAVLMIKITDSATGFIEVYNVDDETPIAKASVGEALANGITIRGLKAGSHPFNIKYTGDECFAESECNASVIVKKADAWMEVNLPSEACVGDVVIVSVTLPGDATGNVTLFVNGTEVITEKLENGKANITAEGLSAGSHIISVTYSGDDKYLPDISENMILTITKLVPTITVKTDDIKFGEVATITVTVPEDATGFVLVDLGIAKSYGEIKDGKAIINVLGLPKGNYTANALFLEDGKYAEARNTSSFEVIKDPEYFIKVTMVNGLQLTSVLTDDDGNAVAGAVVSYTLGDGKTVNVTTNDKGEFVCDVKSNSILTMSYTDGNVSCSESIVIKNVALTQKGTQIVVPSNMQRTAVDYNAGEKGFDFTFKLLDGDGKPLANKAVKIGIFDKTYTVKTNKDGVGALPINIANANYYTYAVVFLGDDDYKASMGVCSLQIVKKSVTITPAKTSYSFASSAKTKTVSATLKSTNSYIPKGKQVTLTIAGKTFKATIGDKGQINFNIGSITKKGTYKVDIKFAGTNTYAAANSKTITIKIA